MARRKSGRGRRGSMGGLKSILKDVLVGAGITYMTGNNTLGAVGGFVVGGPMGAVGGFFAPQGAALTQQFTRNIPNPLSNSNASSGTSFY